MKIRNGFVSNSSSSSFILIYDKTCVIDDLNEMISYIKNHPNTYPIFYGDEINEGQDAFILTPEQESLIRKFPDRFINQNKSKNITLYTNNAIMIKDSSECSNEEPDMSDIKEPDNVTDEEFNLYMELVIRDKNSIPKELQEKMDKLHAYEKIYDKRVTELIKKKNEERINKAKDEIISASSCKEKNIETMDFYLDNSAVEETTDFAERYLTDEWYTSDSDYVLETRYGYNRPYLLEYEELITDKEQIINYLVNSDNISNNLIFWSNAVFNFIETYEEDFTVDFYRIGKHELDLLKQKLKASSKEVYLATNANIILNDSGNLTKSFNYKLGYGNPVVIEANTDLADFEKEMKNF